MVCVGHGRKPRRQVFSRRGSNSIGCLGDGWQKLTGRSILQEREDHYTEPHIYEQVQAGPWEINKSNLIMTTEKLGHGQFGQVRKGFIKNIRSHNIPVALKTLKGNTYYTRHFPAFIHYHVINCVCDRVFYNSLICSLSILKLDNYRTMVFSGK